MSKRSVPAITSEEEAKAFLEQDLSDLDFSRFKPLDWEQMPKTDRINLRVPYQRLVREAIEKAVQLITRGLLSYC